MSLWVEVNVSGYMLKVGIVEDWRSLEDTLEDRTSSFVFAIEIHGIGSGEALHGFGDSFVFGALV